MNKFKLSDSEISVFRHWQMWAGIAVALGVPYLGFKLGQLYDQRVIGVFTGMFAAVQIFAQVGMYVERRYYPEAIVKRRLRMEEERGRPSGL